jgi:hypothetical protein
MAGNDTRAGRRRQRLKLLVILEDDANRRAEMLRRLDDLLPQVSVAFFRKAGELFRFLSHAGEEPIAISLGNSNDGDDTYAVSKLARDLAEGSKVIAPAIIHTDVGDAAFVARRLLERAGWPVRQVTPTADLAWIGRSWLRAVKILLPKSATARRATRTPARPSKTGGS